MIKYPDTPNAFLQSCKGGEIPDSPKWREFYEAYRPTIQEILRLRKKNLSADDLEDLTQNVFQHLLRCFRTGGYTCEKGRFRGYLFKLVSNLMIDRFRRNRREQKHRSILEEGWEESVKSSGPSPAEILEYAEFDPEALRRLFDEVFEKSRLSEKSKAVYIMLCGEGLSIDEVAAHFGISRNAVSQIKCRVNKALEQAIKKQTGEKNHA